MAIGVSAVLVPSGFGLALLFVVTADPGAPPIAAAGPLLVGALAAATPAILRARGLTWTGNWLAALLFAGISSVVLTTGGITSPAVILYPAVVVIAAILAGRRFALAWALGSALVLGALVMMAPRLAAPPTIGDDARPLFTLLFATLSLGTHALLSSLFGARPPPEIAWEPLLLDPRESELRQKTTALELVSSIAAIANASQTGEDMLHGCLRAICDAVDFDVVAPVFDHTIGMHLIHRASDPSATGDALAAIQRSAWLRRLQESQEVQWIDLNSTDPLTSTIQSAEIHQVLGVPVHLKDGDEHPPVSVLLMSSSRERPPNLDSILHAIQVALGAHLAQVIARENAAKAAHQAQRAAEAASLAKSDFLATMSHEIRTPMNGVIGMASLLLDSKLGPEEREYAEVIRSSGQALLNVLGDILDFSKIESGKLDIELQEVVIRDSVEETLDLFSASAADKEIGLAYTIDAACPESCTSDPTRLRQILANLVGNAVKFTSEGDVDVHVDVAEGMLRFTVRDSGIGIAENHMSRLFKPFSQVEASTSRRFGGTGLGLAICKRLVELLGGEIGVDSEVGRGSAFSFTVELRSPSPPAEDTPWLRGRRAAIVEPSRAVGDALRLELSRWGVECHRFATLAEALREAGPALDLLFIDAGLTSELGALQGPAKNRVVLLLPLNSPRDAYEDLSDAEFVNKPIKRAHLRRAMETLFSVQPTTPTPERSSHNEPMATLLPARVLVVDDSAINLKVAVSLLGRLGYRADTASDGAAALELIHKIPYDVVFMDIQMPVLDGVETTRRLRSDHTGPQPAVIAMTAEALDGDEARCRAAGMDDYVSKPVQLLTLSRVLRRTLLTRSRVAQEEGKVRA